SWQELDAFDEVGLQAESKLFRLKDAAHPLDTGVERYQRIEVSAGLLAVFQWRPGNDALKARIFPGSLDYPLCFKQSVRWLDLDLQINHSLNSYFPGMLSVLINIIAFVEQFIIIQPGHTKMSGVPEVKMCVNDRKIWHRYAPFS